MIKISIIIPVYNDPEGLEGTLESLLAQSRTLDDVEILVVDNNSNDTATPAVLEDYARRFPGLIRPMEERRRQSSYAARNTGIQAARGDLLAFIDAGCVAWKDWLREGLAALEASGAAMAAGAVRFTFEGDKPNFWGYFDASRKLNQKAYAAAGFGATANIFIARRVFDQYGLFRDDLISGGDYEFGRRATDAGEGLVYAEKAGVDHPARDSFHAIVKKTRRIAMGQAILEKGGDLQNSSLSIRLLVPCFRSPGLPGHSLPWPYRVIYPVMRTVFTYYSIWMRVRFYKDYVDR